MKNIKLKVINPLENLNSVKELLLQLDPEKGEKYIQKTLEQMQDSSGCRRRPC